LSTSLLVCWFGGSLVFWAAYISWLSVLCLMYGQWIFSPTLWAVFSVKSTFLDSTYELHYVILVFPCILISLNRRTSSSIHIFKSNKISPFIKYQKCYSVVSYVPHFVIHSLIEKRLFLFLGYEYCHMNTWVQMVFQHTDFISIEYPGWNYWIIWCSSAFNVLKMLNVI
jgi:hypothetical protein